MSSKKFTTSNKVTISFLEDLAKAKLTIAKHIPVTSGSEAIGFAFFGTNFNYYGPYTAGSIVANEGAEVSLEEMINLIIFKEKEVSVRLNSGHVALVTKNGITVGCQTFPLDVVKKLSDAVAEVTR